MRLATQHNTTQNKTATMSGDKQSPVSSWSPSLHAVTLSAQSSEHSAHLANWSGLGDCTPLLVLGRPAGELALKLELELELEGGAEGGAGAG